MNEHRTDKHSVKGGGATVLSVLFLSPVVLQLHVLHVTQRKAGGGVAYCGCGSVGAWNMLGIWVWCIVGVAMSTPVLTLYVPRCPNTCKKRNLIKNVNEQLVNG